MMLLVHIDADSGPARAGTAGPVLATVNVTDLALNAVQGLDQTNFAIRAVYISTKPGQPEPATFTDPTEDPAGVYSFSLFRNLGTESDVWDAGEFVFAIEVRRSGDSGRTLLSVQIKP